MRADVRIRRGGVKMREIEGKGRWTGESRRVSSPLFVRRHKQRVRLLLLLGQQTRCPEIWLGGRESERKSQRSISRREGKEFKRKRGREDVRSKKERPSERRSERTKARISEDDRTHFSFFSLSFSLEKRSRARALFLTHQEQSRAEHASNPPPAVLLLQQQQKQPQRKQQQLRALFFLLTANFGRTSTSTSSSSFSLSSLTMAGPSASSSRSHPGLAGSLFDRQLTGGPGKQR